MNMPTLTYNQFLHNCFTHGKACDAYCTNCKQFKCSECAEPHILDHCTFNSRQIYWALLHLHHSKEIALITDTRYSIDSLLNQTIVMLPNWFAHLVMEIDRDIEYRSCIENTQYSHLVANISKQLNDKLFKKKLSMRLINAKFKLATLIKILEKVGPYLKMPLTNFATIRQKLATNIHTSLPKEVIQYINNTKIYSILRQYIVANQKVFITNISAWLTQPFVHYLNGSNITIYYPFQKQKVCITLDQRLNECTDSICHERRIFAMGGNQINDVYEVNIPKKTLIAKKSMIAHKYYYTLCSACGYIYSIGGSDNSKHIYDCEKYSIHDDKWLLLPNLLTTRSQSAVIAFNNCYIYCICGYSNGKCINSMEKLRIGGVGWECINMKSPISERLCAYGVQLNEKHMVVFGGCSDDTLNDSYLITVKDGCIIKCISNANLRERSYFCRTSTPVVLNGCIYAVDNGKRIHVYGNNKWGIIQ